MTSRLPSKIRHEKRKKKNKSKAQIYHQKYHIILDFKEVVMIVNFFFTSHNWTTPFPHKKGNPKGRS